MSSDAGFQAGRYANETALCIIPEVSGTELLFHQRLGDGETPVVFLHGFLGSGRNLRGLAQRSLALHPDRTFWLIDLPGHGQSPPLAPGEDLRSMAARVEATVAAFGLVQAPRVLGHSLGGRVALAWLRAAPQAFADLTLLDIAPGPLHRDGSASWRILSAVRQAPAEAPDRRSLRAFLIDVGLSPGTADWVLMNVVCETQGCRWRIDREALAALHARVNDDDLWDVVAHADVPLRCIRGGASSYVSDADASRLASLGCEVETVAGAGHDVHADAPDDVAARFG